MRISCSYIFKPVIPGTLSLEFFDSAALIDNDQSCKKIIFRSISFYDSPNSKLSPRETAKTYSFASKYQPKTELKKITAWIFTVFSWQVSISIDWFFFFQWRVFQLNRCQMGWFGWWNFFLWKKNIIENFHIFGFKLDWILYWKLTLLI